MRNILDEQWCCLNCTNKFRLGAGIPVSGNMLRCPICRSTETHPIGKSVTLKEYLGKIGTKN